MDTFRTINREQVKLKDIIEGTQLHSVDDYWTLKKTSADVIGFNVCRHSNNSDADYTTEQILNHLKNIWVGILTIKIPKGCKLCSRN